jgi:predicted nucleic acid-binding protein
VIALADASIAIKWFHAAGESEVEASRQLLDAHLDGSVEILLLDLTLYEVANSLLRRHHWPAEQVEAVLVTLDEVHAALTPDPDERRAAARLAGRDGLTYYDASYAAVAALRGLELITANRELLDGYGRTATEVASLL